MDGAVTFNWFRTMNPSGTAKSSATDETENPEAQVLIVTWWFDFRRKPTLLGIRKRG